MTVVNKLFVKHFWFVYCIEEVGEHYQKGRNNAVVIIRENCVIYNGEVCPIEWIATWAFKWLFKGGETWYYIKKSDGQGYIAMEGRQIHELVPTSRINDNSNSNQPTL